VTTALARLRPAPATGSASRASCRAGPASAGVPLAAARRGAAHAGFFEAPHRLAAALARSSAAAFGAAAAGGGLPGADQDLRGGTPRCARRAGRLGRPGATRGEITLVVAAHRWPTRCARPTGAARRVAEVENHGGTSRRDAIAQVARRLALPRREVYQRPGDPARLQPVPAPVHQVTVHQVTVHQVTASIADHQQIGPAGWPAAPYRRFSRPGSRCAPPAQAIARPQSSTSARPTSQPP